jgi:drug/metabolite transporter (DMT)-like permease
VGAPNLGRVTGESPLTALAFILCALIWSTTWFAIRVCIGAGGYPPFAGAAIRFALATAVLSLLVALRLAGRGPRHWRQRGWIAGAGVLCAVAYGLVYAGETRISGGLAAVIYGTLPLVTAIVTYVTHTERASPAALAGAALALVGIAVIYRDRMDVSGQQATGVAMLFASVCACAVFNTIVKRHARDTDPLATSATFLGAACAALALFALLYEHRLPPWPPPVRPTIALFYLALVGSVVAFALYFYLIERMRLMALSTLVFIEPVLAMLIDAAWEHEIRLTAQAYAGAAITLAGVAVSLLLRPRGSARSR